jgi:hypothetical protein
LAVGADVWANWFEIESRSAGRPVMLYGRSEDWVHKALQHLSLAPEGIIDRDPAYRHSTYRGLPVFPIEEVTSPHQYFFIITAGEFHGIVEILESLGLSAGTDFVCSPDFKDYSKLLELRTLVSTILLSSSDYCDTSRARSSKSGGGLYLLDVETGRLSCVYQGSTRQLTRLPGEFLAAVDYVAKELLIFDKDFSVVRRMDLVHPNTCGLTFSESRGLLYVANAGRDTISTYDLERSGPIEELPFGRGLSGRGGHHINDLTIHDDTLFSSHFSWSGYFKQGVFDGGVAAWDLRALSSGPTEVISGLWKPHSPIVVQGDLHVLDSMRGELRTGRPTPKSRLNAFVRGIDCARGVLAIGQSEDMYITERLDQSGSTIIANAGVNVMNYEESSIAIARFISTPQLMNIHDLLIWEGRDARVS